MIEVLVVIAIIAIVSAIVLPVLQRSKKQGKDLLCSSNLRQLGYAVSIYTQDNSNYPESFCRDDEYCHRYISWQQSTDLGISNTDDLKGYWWFNFLANIIDENPANKDGIFWCPSRNVPNPSSKSNILCNNYGINYTICKIIETKNSPADEFTGIPLRPQQVRSPASKLLLMDSGYALISWKALAANSSLYPFENPDRQDVYYLPGAAINQQRLDDGSIDEIQQDDAIKGRHSSGKFNTIFADGHVDRKRPSFVEPVFDADGNFLNCSSWFP